MQFRQTILTLTVIFTALSAQAEPAWPEYLDIDFSYRNSSPLPEDRTLDLRLGLGLEREPTFQGSNQSTAEIDPFVVVGYRADWGNLFLTGAGIGFSRLVSPSIGLYVNLEAEDKREQDDDDRLRGLGDQDEELELEIVARYLLGPWQLGGSVALAGGDKGIVWFLGGNRTWRLANNRLFVTARADLSGSDADNQQTDFGITASQAAGSAFGYPEYSPGGGLKSFGAGVTIDYQFANRWLLYGELEVENFLGDIADSPMITLGGSRTNAEISIGVYRRF